MEGTDESTELWRYHNGPAFVEFIFKAKERSVIVVHFN